MNSFRTQKLLTKILSFIWFKFAIGEMCDLSTLNNWGTDSCQDTLFLKKVLRDFLFIICFLQRG
jgi:hypothetical protein